MILDFLPFPYTQETFTDLVASQSTRIQIRFHKISTRKIPIGFPKDSNRKIKSYWLYANEDIFV